MGSVLVWADIPVLDIERARAFYNRVLQLPVEIMPETGDAVALVMGDAPSVDLALTTTTKPSTTHGTTIYFSANGDMDGLLARVTEAGGTVLEGKQFMGPMVGWIAFFEDTEGNRIGVQQPAEE